MDIRVGSLCPDLHAEETKEDYEAHHEGEGGKLQPGEVDAPAAPHDDEVIIMTATSRAARHAAPLDARRVIVSLLAFIAFFELGGLVGMLGPSLPSLSARLGRCPRGEKHAPCASLSTESRVDWYRVIPHLTCRGCRTTRDGPRAPLHRQRCGLSRGVVHRLLAVQPQEAHAHGD